MGTIIYNHRTGTFSVWMDVNFDMLQTLQNELISLLFNQIDFTKPQKLEQLNSTHFVKKLGNAPMVKELILMNCCIGIEFTEMVLSIIKLNPYIHGFVLQETKLKKVSKKLLMNIQERTSANRFHCYGILSLSWLAAKSLTDEQQTWLNQEKYTQPFDRLIDLCTEAKRFVKS